MRWTPGGRSDDLEDRRNEGGGGIGGIHLGIGGILILLVLSIVFKRDFFSLVGGGQSVIPGTSGSQADPQRDARCPASADHSGRLHCRALGGNLPDQGLR